MSDQRPYAAYVGIDWADQEHAVCMFGSDGKRPEQSVLEQSAEAIDAWAGELLRRFGGQPVAVALEQSRGALIYALMKYPHLVLFPLNPKQLARYREAVSPSGAKNDPTDAKLLGEFLWKHHGILRAWKPDDVATRTIRGLAEARRDLVGERTRLTNNLRQKLKECFPQALKLVGAQVHVESFLKLLAKYPTLKEMQRASPKTLVAMLPRRRHVAPEDGPSAQPADPGTDRSAADPRLKMIRQAMPYVTDEALLLPNRLAIVTLVELILALNKSIDDHDCELAKLMREHPDAELFKSFPGAGPALAPRLLAAMGADRERFDSAVAVQQASGTAPVTIQSGKSCDVRRRRACAKFLKQTFHEFAEHSLKGSRWARAYYDLMRKQKGARHHAAVRALAFKWIRIIYCCWKDRSPYNELQYLTRLRKTNSPLLAYVASEESD